MMGNKKERRASARLLSKICLLAFLIIFMLPCIVKADDAVYSTVGGTWIKVNDSTWTMDKDGDGKTDVTLLKEGDEWKYIFNVADDSSLYYGWEVNPPEGYEVENGYGTKQNPAIGIQYARTDNIDIDGVQNGDYEGGIDTTKVYTVPGASQIVTSGKYDLADGDFLVIWSGNHPEYTAVDDYEKGDVKRGNRNLISSFSDNTITVGFHSEKDGKKGYGYYIKIIGNTNINGLTATNVSTEEPALDVGNLYIKKQVLEADGSPSTDDKIFKFNIELSSDDDKISVMLANKKEYGDVTIDGGKGSFYLSNGGNVNLTGIPAGVKYHITEDATDGYESVLTNGDGAIQKNKTATVTCTNTRKTQPEVKKQTLTIKKIVKNGDNKDNFTFHISFSNLEKNVKYKYKKGDAETAFASDKDGTADVTFMLANNENVVFENIPENTKYQVTEDANKYYHNGA